jgi:hypothetical protein
MWGRNKKVPTTSTPETTATTTAVSEPRGPQSTVRELGARIAAWTAPLAFESVTTTDDYCVIVSRGGESRWYVILSDGQYIVSSAQRSHTAQWFEMSTASLDDVERFLIGLFGASLRSELLPEAPRLAPLVRIDDLPTPFTYVPAADDARRGLLLHNGRERARFSSFATPHAAVRFSQYANVPVETLKAAFLDPQGAPVFALHPTQLSA